MSLIHKIISLNSPLTVLIRASNSPLTVLIRASNSPSFQFSSHLFHLGMCTCNNYRQVDCICRLQGNQLFNWCQCEELTSHQFCEMGHFSWFYCYLHISCISPLAWKQWLLPTISSIDVPRSALPLWCHHTKWLPGSALPLSRQCSNSTASVGSHLCFQALWSYRNSQHTW